MTTGAPGLDVFARMTPIDQLNVLVAMIDAYAVQMATASEMMVRQQKSPRDLALEMVPHRAQLLEHLGKAVLR